MARSKKSREQQNNRARAWCVIAYPESLPDGWRDILDDLHIEWVESPLHDKDVEDGKPKKPHYHLVFAFETVKSEAQVREITDKLKAARPERCVSLRGAVRYLAHIGNPDKYHYPVEDIIAHGGFDVRAILAATYAEKADIVREMMEWCRNNGITEFCDVAEYAADLRPDWFECLGVVSPAYFMDKYIRSRRYKVLGGDPYVQHKQDKQ